MKHAKNYFSLLSLFLFLSIPLLTHAQSSTCPDDPKDCQTTHEISFAKHPDTQISSSDIDALLAYSSSIIQNCDGSGDIQCNITLTRKGSVGTYGSAGDGSDIITSQAEKNAAIVNNTGYATFVTSIAITKIKAGTMVTSNITGSADLNGSGLVMARKVGTTDRIINHIGRTFAHEFMHTRGIRHRTSPGQPIMKDSFNFTYNQVNEAECRALHTTKGSTALISTTTQCNDKKADVVFIIDDTGSMSQEIAGVRNAVLRKLSTFSAEQGLVFQLVTYKDVSNPRDTTSNLSTISTQVAALRASGGGDCPENVEAAINDIKDNVEEGGQVFIYTDASPRSGVTLASLTAVLKAQDIRVSTIVSGDCYSSLASAPLSAGGSSTTTSSSSLIPYSDNGDPSYTPPSSPALTTLPQFVSSVEAFSYVANETGGLFAFVPEVNTSSEGRTRYENTAFNILNGGIDNGLVFADPAKGPRGSVLNVKLITAEESFSPDEEIAVTFSDPAIQVLATELVSPTELIATVQIGTTAAITFHDVTISIEGSDYIAEISGEGIFKVDPATTLPTITAITPAMAGQGETVDLTISGINTNFGSGSVVSFGSGITVLNTTAVNSNLLEVKIQVSSSASIGFRTVTVSTGGQTVNRSLGFLVTAPSCAITGVESGAFLGCDPTGTFSQEVVVTYNAAPATGTLVVNNQAFPITGSPQTVVLSGLPSEGDFIDVTAYFSDDLICSFIKEDEIVVATACAPSGPDAPTNLIVYADTAFLPSLRWTDNSGDELGFVIYRSLNGAAEEAYASVPADQTYYYDVIGSGSATYRITAYNNDGESASTSTETYSMPNVLARMDLTFVCYDATTDSLTWNVSNTNAQYVPYIWAQWWSSDRDTLYAIPGNSTFKTKNNPQTPVTYGDDNITGIWYWVEGLNTGFDEVFTIPLSQSCAATRQGFAPRSLPARRLPGMLNTEVKQRQDQHLKDLIQVAPNPFRTTVEIPSVGLDQGATFRVVNLLGQEMLTQRGNLSQHTTLDLSELSAGIYFLYIRAGSASMSQKIVKE